MRKTPLLEWQPGEQLRLADGNDQRSATYQLAARHYKPSVHPLVTAAGAVLSGFEMSDHVWHRGLWFTIKLINGTNFWEENDPFGVQTATGTPVCEFISDQTLRYTHDLRWTAQATGPVLEETRKLEFHLTPEGTTVIDWRTQLKARADLTLDRTPFTTWGGYGGLSFRAARELHNANFLLPDGQTTGAITGQSHPWVVLQGQVDGGGKRMVSLGMIDHPANLRAPSPWYCKCNPGFTFLNAAFLFHEPYLLKKDQVIDLRYRVITRDGLWTAAEFGALADTFRKEA